jgi:hypothetical protein
MGFRGIAGGRGGLGCLGAFVLALSFGAPFGAAAYEGDSSIRSGPVDSTSSAPGLRRGRKRGSRTLA